MRANLQKGGQIARQTIAKFGIQKSKGVRILKPAPADISKIKQLKQARSERARLSWVIRRLKSGLEISMSK